MKEIIFREKETSIPVKGKQLVPVGELIRCKDCKHQEDKGRRYKDCSQHFLRAYDDFFCADGERRENE